MFSDFVLSLDRESIPVSYQFIIQLSTVLGIVLSELSLLHPKMYARWSRQRGRVLYRGIGDYQDALQSPNSSFASENV
jgi:hypothetical protein